MNENMWRESSSYPVANGKDLWLAQLVFAALIATFAIVLALIPASRFHAGIQSAYTGFPDGNRARGTYSVDGGYGLGADAYTELVAQLQGTRSIARALPSVQRDPPPASR